MITYDHMDPKMRLVVIETCNPFYEYEGVKSSKSFHVPSKSLFTMVFQKTRRKIVISDYMDKSLKIIDVNGNFQEKISQIGYLEKPWAISSNSKNEIFVTDYEEKGIIKLDANFKFSRKIGDKTIRNACYMALDPDNEDIMYLTHYIENRVSVWNISDNKYINSFGIDTPEYIQIKRNKIFLTSRTEVEYIEGRKEFRRITEGIFKLKFKKNLYSEFLYIGSNCIFVLSKSNYSILNAIRIDEWIDPRGLYVDDNLNILTTAFKLDDENNRSDWRYLFIINERNFSLTLISEMKEQS